MRDSTIAAIATARGEAALSIVRLSGPDAVEIAARVFRGSGSLESVDSHTAWFGSVVDADGLSLDQVVATVFREPRSSTGENVVEFTCHGGETAPSSVLRALYTAGAQPAEPGQFTRRAFLNGKVDLEQAEAVVDLIHSRSRAAHRVSLRQLEGRLGERLSALRSRLLEVCGLIELELDFSEEDVEFADRSRLESLLEELDATISNLLRSADLTRPWRDGLAVVIAGRPNAGKSTLLNALVGADRVIVSSTPGTTRDFVECEFELDGVLLRLTDTAGIRSTGQEIEREGVRRSEELLQTADMVVYVYDSTTGLENEETDYLGRLHIDRPDLPVVMVANKSDLLGPGTDPGPGLPLSAIRARQSGSGLEPLIEDLRRSLPAEVLDYEASDGMINQRHRSHLEVAGHSIQVARQMLSASAGGELLALEMRTALDALGAITGEITNEDVLGEIFGRFCIGK